MRGLTFQYPAFLAAIAAISAALIFLPAAQANGGPLGNFVGGGPHSGAPPGAFHGGGPSPQGDFGLPRRGSN